MKMKLFSLSETKLFHFHGIFEKKEIKSEKQIPPPPQYTSEPPLQKSWIHPSDHISYKIPPLMSIYIYTYPHSHALTNA